jgi:hypothetical protein
VRGRRSMFERECILALVGLIADASVAGVPTIMVMGDTDDRDR